jgi:hypothetical protein
MASYPTEREIFKNFFAAAVVVRFRNMVQTRGNISVPFEPCIFAVQNHINNSVARGTALNI